MQPKFHFRHAFQFVQLLEDAKSSIFKANGNLLLMSNPLMVLVLTTDILKKLRKQFRSLELRINFFNETF